MSCHISRILMILVLIELGLLQISKTHDKYGDQVWNLDRGPIFNHVDSFIQRCRDMIEICEAMIIFGRHDETEALPKPTFGSSKADEFNKWAERIENMFADSLNDVAEVKGTILDVQAASWFDDILKFKSQMKDIEVVLENLTNAVFDNVANLEDGIEALAAFYNYQKRKTLSSLFDSKTLEVYQ